MGSVTFQVILNGKCNGRGYNVGIHYHIKGLATLAANPIKSPPTICPFPINNHSLIFPPFGIFGAWFEGMPKTMEHVAKEAENNSYEFHEDECHDDLAHTVSSDWEIMGLYEEATRFLKEGNRPAYRQCMKVVKEETIIQKLQRNVRRRQVELEEAQRVLKETKQTRNAGCQN